MFPLISQVCKTILKNCVPALLEQTFIKIDDLIGSIVYIIPFEILQRHLFSWIKMSPVSIVIHYLCIEMQLQLQSGMKEVTSLLILEKQKGYKGMLWTTVCQQIRQLRWNGQIPRKTKTIETDSRISTKSQTSLVAQWLRICLPMQRTRVRALVQEDSTCCGATKPVSHNYWACALEPTSHNYWAHMHNYWSPRA